MLADDDLYFRTNLLVLRNTMVANFFDLTAISLPLPGTALPVGFMLIARHGRDRELLAIAAAVEAEFGRA
jgi:aspartyl-tRNA(Asn)/glutamyl-tRNA(Gln) amidotransferase subunit A